MVEMEVNSKCKVAESSLQSHQRRSILNFVLNIHHSHYYRVAACPGRSPHGFASRWLSILAANLLVLHRHGARLCVIRFVA